VNPRASRTVPFVSKVTGVPVAKIATQVMLGKTLKELGVGARAPALKHIGVKESVFPWTRFPGTDAILGPEMKSTGEVMGIDRSFPIAFAKSQIGAGTKVPLAGTVFLSVKPPDRKYLEGIARGLREMGFQRLATRGTGESIRRFQVPVTIVKKVSEGRPNVLDYLVDGRVHLVINTPSGKSPKKDEVSIRTTAVARNVPLVTTIEAAETFVEAIRELRSTRLMTVSSLQEYHRAATIVAAR
jgi:carbamoyl-phosphate synthase large subunit